jgi:ATP-dependent DNA helicase RecQ
MRLVYGIGDAKLREYGQRFLHIVSDHCRQRRLSMDNRPGQLQAPEPRKNLPRPNPERDLAFAQFRQGAALEDVIHQTNRARSTVKDYLCEFIREERPASVKPWVSDEMYQRVTAAARQVGTERLKPIFVALGETVSYDDIRIVVTHLSVRAGSVSDGGIRR